MPPYKIAANMVKQNCKGFEMDDCVTIDQGIDSVAEAVADDRVDNGIAKRKCLVFLLIVSLISGFLFGIVPQEPDFLYGGVGESEYYKPIEFASSLIITFAVLAWCYLDAEERNFNFSRKASICFVLFPFIGFPWYILKARQGMACLKIFAKAALFIVLCLIAFGLGCVSGLSISYILPT